MNDVTNINMEQYDFVLKLPFSIIKGFDSAFGRFPKSQSQSSACSDQASFKINYVNKRISISLTKHTEIQEDRSEFFKITSDETDKIAVKFGKNPLSMIGMINTYIVSVSFCSKEKFIFLSCKKDSKNDSSYLIFKGIGVMEEMFEIGKDIVSQNNTFEFDRRSKNAILVNLR